MYQTDFISRERFLQKNYLLELREVVRLLAALAFSWARCLFFAMMALFLCNLTGVTSRWIAGLFIFCLVWPSFNGRGRRIMYCRTSSSFIRLKSFRIFPTRLVPIVVGQLGQSVQGS